MCLKNSGKLSRQKVDLTKYIENHSFSFDSVFGEDKDNHYIYQDLIQPLIASAFNKSKVTCFAYGQTGSGKTFTMMGDMNNGMPGLYLLAANDIFKILQSPDFEHLVVGISFYEIYCGKAYDLFNDRESCFIRLDAKETVNIVGLTEKIIANTESLMSLINYGLSVRITGTTGMNDNSSRSHAILQINLRTRDRGKLHGKLSFIDLAGSERGADVRNTGKKTRFDGAEINKSLLALKECIRALDLEKKHLPFRGSKLTLVLKDSFVGNCRTVMIGNISPAVGSSEHTLNTLRYADRVKELKKGKGSKPMSKKDQLARQLMLPRMDKRSNKVKVVKDTSGNQNLNFEVFDVNQNSEINKLNINNFQHDENKDLYAKNDSKAFLKEDKEEEISKPKTNRGFKKGNSKDSGRRTNFIQEQMSEENFMEMGSQSGVYNRNTYLNKFNLEKMKSENDIQTFNNNSQKQDLNMQRYLSKQQRQYSSNNNGLFNKQNESERHYISNNKPSTNQNQNGGKQRQLFIPEQQEDEEVMEMINDFRDQLLDDHSNHLDGMVNLIKNDMGIISTLKNKDTDLNDYIRNARQVIKDKKKALVKFERILMSYENEFKELEKKQMNMDTDNFDDDIFEIDDPNDNDLFDNFDNFN